MHLTFEALQPPPGAQQPSWAQLAEALGPDVLATRPVLLQLGDKAAVLTAGGVLQEEGPAKPAAQLQRVSPCCVVAGRPAQLRLQGTQLGAAGTKLHARCQGHFLQLEGPAAGSSMEAVQLPALASPGWVSLELEQALLIGEPLQVLVVPDAEMAGEVERLEAALGILLDYCTVCGGLLGQRLWQRARQVQDSAHSHASSSSCSSLE